MALSNSKIARTLQGVSLQSLPLQPMPLQRLLLVLLVCLVGWVPAPSAQAIPTLVDQWQFFCAPRKLTNKHIARARQRASASGLKGGIAALNYACILGVYEQEVYRARVAKFQQQGGSGAPPQLSRDRSSAQLKAALARLAKVYESNKLDPKAIYHYAYALALVGDDFAINRFDELMSDFKVHPLAKQSYLVLGDFYFEKRALDKAFREYNSAIKHGSITVQFYTRYKLAWIKFGLAVDERNVLKQRQAIKVFADIYEKLAKIKNARLRRLADTIKSEVIDLLVQQGDMGVAQTILKSIDAEEVYADLLERMAYARVAANDAAGAYRYFALALKEAPTRPEALQRSMALVDIAARTNDVKQLVGNLAAMVKSYAQGRSPWRIAQKKDKSLSKKAAKQTENLLYDYATGLDRQGREGNNGVYLTAARQLYALYIKNFPKSKRTPEAKEFYGQILFVQQQYAQAASYYLALIRESPKANISADAADVMVTAAQYVFDADKTPYRLSAPGAASQALKLPPSRKLFADCLDAFLKLRPKAPTSAAMTYAAASIYYDFGHYDIAVKRYFDFISKFSKDENAKAAAARILVYYQGQKDTKGFQGARKKLAAVPALRAVPELQPYFTSANTVKKREDEREKASPEEPAVQEAANEAAVAAEGSSEAVAQDGDQDISGEAASSEREGLPPEEAIQAKQVQPVLSDEEQALEEASPQL